ncbi:shikimate 5-dehydrogenase [Tersicoccus solisilvae]|uniref:Shikimate 5-dehydrogenase n=1 Tax=Tersicoccus solisilvae TaxID=1882339 RepID=A0ABQ1NQ41_9MICC|nr:shikimate dehydrogenase [Tersicoccus solisilvae]GGC82639.1 shikimate 5-dehydrogenase [Tersicoccus solisilvae]
MRLTPDHQRDGAPGEATTRRAAVLGHPIAHSLSPVLHPAAYRVLETDIAYEAIDTTLEQLDDVLRRIRAEDVWIGLSVTMPLKAAVAERVDRLAGRAEALGVVNTVTVSGDPGARVLTGHNTDVDGIVGAVTHAGAAPGLRGAILGGGGTATAAVAALAALAAREVDVFVRDSSRAANVRRVGRRLGVDLTFCDWDDAVARLAEADLVVATLPPRGADGLAAAMVQAHTAVRPGAVLLDAAYDPWPSALADHWERAGGTIVPGLEMLLYQAVEQVRLFAPDAWDARIVDADARSTLLDAMCDAVGLPRRG